MPKSKTTWLFGVEQFDSEEGRDAIVHIMLNSSMVKEEGNSLLSLRNYINTNKKMKSLTQYIKECMITEITDSSQLVDLFNDIASSRRQVTESSINRLIKWFTECDCAFISGFRNELTNIHNKSSEYT